jgi:sRNA-binding protein
MATVILLLKGLSEILKDEFSEFARPAAEQKFVEVNTQPASQTAEKREQTAQAAQGSPPTPAQEQQAAQPDRVTPKLATKTRPEWQ